MRRWKANDNEDDRPSESDTHNTCVWAMGEDTQALHLPLKAAPPASPWAAENNDPPARHASVLAPRPHNAVHGMPIVSPSLAIRMPRRTTRMTRSQMSMQRAHADRCGAQHASRR